LSAFTGAREGCGPLSCSGTTRTNCE
jgi:hypothetical protein